MSTPATPTPDVPTPNPGPDPDPAPTPDPLPAATGDDGESRVPYSRFSKVNEELKAAKREAADLAKWKAEQEDKGRTELERAAKRAEDAEQRAAELEQKAVRLERGGWVRAAAGEFSDPDDALAFIDLAAIEDEKAAKAAVADLAKRKPHLLRGDQTGPTPFGTLGAGESTIRGAKPKGTGKDGEITAEDANRGILSSLFGSAGRG